MPNEFVDLPVISPGSTGQSGTRKKIIIIYHYSRSRAYLLRLHCIPIKRRAATSTKSTRVNVFLGWFDSADFTKLLPFHPVGLVVNGTSKQSQNYCSTSTTACSVAVRAFKSTRTLLPIAIRQCRINSENRYLIIGGQLLHKMSLSICTSYVSRYMLWAWFNISNSSCS